MMKNECQVKGYKKSTIYNFTVAMIKFQTEGYWVISLDELFLEISYHWYNELVIGQFQKMYDKKWIYYKDTKGGYEIECVSKNLSECVLEYINKHEPPRKEE